MAQSTRGNPWLAPTSWCTSQGPCLTGAFEASGASLVARWKAKMESQSSKKPSGSSKKKCIRSPKSWEIAWAAGIFEDFHGLSDFGSGCFLHRSLILESLRSSQSCGQFLGDNSMVSDEELWVLEAILDLFDWCFSIGINGCINDDKWMFDGFLDCWILPIFAKGILCGLIAELTAYAFVLPTFERFLCPFLAQPRFNASQQSAILQKMHISEVQLDISNSMFFVVVIDMIGSGCSFKYWCCNSHMSGCPTFFPRGLALMFACRCQKIAEGLLGTLTSYNSSGGNPPC